MGSTQSIYISKQNQRMVLLDSFSKTLKIWLRSLKLSKLYWASSLHLFLCYGGSRGTAWPPLYYTPPIKHGPLHNSVHYLPHYTAGNRWNPAHSHDAGSSEAPIFLRLLLCPLAVTSSTPHIIPFRGRITCPCSGFTISTWTALSGGRAPLCFLHPFQMC